MFISSAEPLVPGFLVVHANLPEQLRALVVSWTKAYPLAVLETETVLVQSNGIAQWLKLALAADPDVADEVDELAEDASAVWARAASRFKQLDSNSLNQALRAYGNVTTRKRLEGVFRAAA